MKTNKSFRFLLSLFFASFILAGCPMVAPQDDFTYNPEDDDPAGPKGASMPFITYEAEDAFYTGEVITGRTYRTLQGEASGKAAVRLTGYGQYVEFTLVEPANALVFRYAMPDTDGRGQWGTLKITANGSEICEVITSSRHAAIYGSWPYTNAQAPNRRIRFYDDARQLLGGTYPAGTKIGIKKEDAVDWYAIDLAEFEIAPEPLAQPANSVSIADYGAVGNGVVNSRNAFNNAVNAAKSAGKSVWIPPGTFRMDGTGNLNVNGVKIYGAGIWHSNLTGGPYFRVSGSNNHFKDFSILGDVTERVDSNRHCGFEPQNTTGDIYENLWIEHSKCGIWAVNMRNSTIKNNRIRNNYADGINLASNSSNNIVEHNDLRNHGDDGIAINSENGKHNTGNIIRNNTVRLTYHASLLAIYGGGDNTLRNNLLCDTIAFGSAINISSRFNPQGYSGTTTVSGNTAYRTGSAAANTEWNKKNGAIWVAAWDKNFDNGSINITGNRLIDCLYDGITIDGTHAINNSLRFVNNSIEGANGYGVLIHSGNVTGSAVFTDTSVTGAAGAFRNNRGSSFKVSGSGNSW